MDRVQPGLRLTTRGTLAVGLHMERTMLDESTAKGGAGLRDPAP